MHNELHFADLRLFVRYVFKPVGIIFIFCIVAINAFAQSMGDVADNILQPVDMLQGVMHVASIVMGIYLVTAAFMRYLRFRQNPQESPISTVILWAIFGVLFILLPFVHNLTLLAAEHTGTSGIVE